MWPVVILRVATFFAVLLPTAERPELGWWPCLLLGLMIPFVAEMGVPSLTRVSHVIAKCSYGIFPVHVPLLCLWIREIPDLPAVGRWPGFVSSCAVLPAILYWTVEHPMILRGGKVAGRLAATAGSAPAVSVRPA
jgi:peptidoglycan/LPS O-acetylase OafA/YrhL